MGQAAIGTALVEADTLDDEPEPVVPTDHPEFGVESENSLYAAGAVVGQYRLLSLLGEGSIGRVYLAEHLAIGRRVALKMVRSELAKTRSVVERFFGEARAVNQIQHENIVEITDFVREDDAGRSYYIMELLEGETLRDVLDADGVVPLVRAFDILGQVTRALDAVHAKGIVHRDLKPENIFLCQRDGADFVKLLDFGVAKLSKLRDPKLAHTTRVGALVGTPMYMAPEQTLGMEVDHRSDIYALGVLLYEMVTGQPPFEEKDLVELLEAHRARAPVAPRTIDGLPHAISEDLERLILACLAKDPQGRPASTAAIRAELERFVRPRRSALPFVMASAALLAVVVLGGVMWSGRAVEPIPIVRAPPVAPSVPAEQKAPSNVEIDFRSTPPAASIFVTGHDEAIGTTPMTLVVEQSEEPITYEVRLPGHEPVAELVTPNRNTAVRVVLAEIPTQPETAAPSTKKRRRAKRRTRKARAARLDKPPRKIESPPPKGSKGIGLGEMRDPYGKPR